jgi:glycogen synthase
LSKLKILVISNLFPPQVIGGYERAIADYARRLHHRGHEVLVLTANVEGLTTSYSQSEPEPMPVKRCLALWGSLTEPGFPMYPQPYATAIAIQNYQILEEEIKLFQPDVCLAGNIDYLGQTVLEQVLAHSIPVAHYIMNAVPGYPVDLTPQSPLYQYITVSNWVKYSLTEKGYPTATAQTIYPGAAVEKFHQSQIPVHDQLRIVFAGLVMPFKGTDVLIEALYLLDQEGIDFTATIAGGCHTPEFRQDLENFVTKEGFVDKVKFTGLLNQQELIELYQNHNIWILPSRFEEPFSIGLLEAMAAGLTIIASDTGGSPEAIAHQVNGLIFASEDALDLADNISFLALHPDEWQAMTFQGQKRALEELSRTKTIEEIESLFYDLQQQS